MGDAKANHGPRTGQVVLAVSALLVSLGQTGCSSIRSPDLPYSQLTAGYQSAVLHQTGSLEVLRSLQASGMTLDPDAVGRAFISQAEAAIASCGESSDRQIGWFSLFVFDPASLSASRKYSFYMHEKALRTPIEPKKVLFPAKQVLLFDCEAVWTDRSGLGNADPYALVQRLAEGLRNDLAKFSPDTRRASQSSELLASYGSLINQVLRDVEIALARSGVFAPDLDTDRGMAFQQTSLGGGRVRMKVQDDRVVAHVEVGMPDTPPAKQAGRSKSWTRTKSGPSGATRASKPNAKKTWEVRLPKIGRDSDRKGPSQVSAMDVLTWPESYDPVWSQTTP